MRENMMIATVAKQRLQEAGFSVDALFRSRESDKRRGPLQVCKSVEGKICVLIMPDGCYFEGLTCWIDSLPFLIAKEVAQDWGLLASND